MTPPPTNQLSEIAVKKEFDLNQVISDIHFYFHLLRQRGETLVVELRKEPQKLEERGG